MLNLLKNKTSGIKDVFTFIDQNIFFSFIEKSKMENLKFDENDENSSDTWSKIVCCTCEEIQNGREEFVYSSGELEIKHICSTPLKSHPNEA